MLRRALLRLALVLAIPLAFPLAFPWGAAQAQAQAPERAVRILVPFPPGGTTDIVARTLAHGATSRLQEAAVVPLGGLPERLAEQTRSESARWGEVVRTSNIRAE
jgi:tripartite-type tricarboxylate transporter receptor subunit TctC